MFNDMVSGLKAKQATLEGRKQDLLDKFLPFRQDLVKGLENFVDLALENGIHGVNRFKYRCETRELMEVEFGLNFMDLVLISTDDVNKLELDKEELAAKVYFYSAGDEDHTPLIEISFIESIDDNHVVRAQWFSSNGPRLFFKGRSMEANLATRLVQSLLNHFYVWEYTWQEKPTMRAARGKDSRRPFGLIPE